MRCIEQMKFPWLLALLVGVLAAPASACCPLLLSEKDWNGGWSAPSPHAALQNKPAGKKENIPPSANASTLLPEGIVDPTGCIGYFAGAADSIEAIDLATGRVLWHTAEAQRPLLLDGHHLLAQAGVKRNRLRILRLDVLRQGECDLECDPLVFPAWVVTGSAHGRSFTAHWRLDRHKLLLDWEANAWHVGKPRPTHEQALAARKHAAGLAQIDLRTGQIEVGPAEKKTVTPPPALPDHLENKALRWRGQDGTLCKVLALEEENGQQRFVLHTWNWQSNQEMERKELLRGKHLLARATLDDKVLCLHEACPSPEEGASIKPKKEPGWWWLFSVQSGELIGRIPDEAGIHDVVLLGKRVFYLVPGPLHGSLDQPSVQAQILKVLDLNSGKKLWEHPVAGKLITPPPL